MMVVIFISFQLGNPLLLGIDLDEIIQAYFMELREGGDVVFACIVVAAAQGIVNPLNVTPPRIKYSPTARPV